MAQHTKAPWTIEKRGHADDIFASGYGIVCEMPDEPDAEARANARLIAAAPELLEALRKSTKYLEKYGAGATCSRAKEVIAKAEGWAVSV